MTSCKCLRCGYRWSPRVSYRPKRCPRCKSQYWNKPYSARAQTIAARIRGDKV